ncbi:serine/threonine protein kinase [Lysobacter pythonis]|uniref:Serine/threonine protein kinase n=1 Tax=Solilutibacter pythonis TaxID=2483112 RepID=A0A3M2HQ90_9GAMM|nr:serine/threonine-protein kinase [Lysobacter pythonis]RMH87924.1 serine/threonine protein kinase [Lysobacter pythonis]
MDPARWLRLSIELDALLDLETDARAVRLAVIAREDPAFARDLGELLAQEATEDSFLDTPLITAPPGPREGEQVGPYRLEKLLGEGGMGQVWLAERADGLYERRVALKLLRPGLADPNLRLRFTRERQILARLAHPHIARLLDAGISAGGQPYLALEHVEGEGILEYCRRRGLGLRQRLQLFRQVCAAVTHAHANLVVHRDLKPSNILVTAQGEVRLLDFGIAKLLDGNEADPPEATRTGVRSFTLHYAAPEQIRGEPVTTQTDVYSLGVILYQLLTGERPYRLKRESNAQWEEAILAADPQRPSQSVRAGTDETLPGIDRRRWSRMLAGDLDNIVLKALSKGPAQRYPSAEAMSLDVQRHLDGMPVLARPQSLAYRARKFIRRHRWPIFVTSTVLISLLGLLGLTWYQRQQAVRETARAQALQDFVIGLFENAGVATTGKPVDVETLVDAGELRGERELARQPRAHAELLGVIARIRIALGQYEEARALLQRQQRLLTLLPGKPPALHLDAATQRGRLRRLQGDAAGCVAILQPLLVNARAVQTQLPALVADYYSQLARCQRGIGEREPARRLFEQSLSLRRGVLGDDSGVVENLTDLAALSVDAGDTVQALSGFQGALAQLHKVAGPRHPLAIDILRSIGTTQQQMGQASAAIRSWKEALALSDDLLGPAHPATLALRRQYAVLLVGEGRLKQGQRELLANHPRVLQRYGTAGHEAAQSWDALGQAAHALGELDRAHDEFLRAARLQRDLKANAALADTLQRDAAVLIEAGRAQAALKVLDDIAGLRGDGPTRGLRLLRAEAHAQLGARGAALAVLESAGDDAEARIVRAILRLDDASTAASAEAELQAIANKQVGDARLLRQHLLAQMGLAEAACRRDAAAGHEAYQRLQATLASLRPEGGVLNRRVRAAGRACAARAREEATAGEARAAARPPAS